MKKQKLPIEPMSPATKIAHFFLIGTIFYILPSGVRLFRFNHLHNEAAFTGVVDALSGSGDVFTDHISGGMILLAVTAFYLIYQLLSGEIKRFFGRTAGYGVIRSVSYAAILICLTATVLTGYLLTRQSSGLLPQSDLTAVHRFAVGALLVFGLVHLLHALFSPRSRMLDVVWGAGRVTMGRMLAALCSLVIALGIYMSVSRTEAYVATLDCHSQNRSVFVDGKKSDIEWLSVDETQVKLHGGINLPDGATTVRVRALRDIHTIYFLFEWDDDSRSLNKHLVKTEGCWQEVRSEEFSSSGETVYSEDQLAIMLSRNPDGCLSTCHLQPNTGTGQHYSEGDTTDLWIWKAISSNPVGQAIDGYVDGVRDSSGSGIHMENAAGGGFRSNLDTLWRQPYFLPKYYFIRDWINIMTDTYEPFAEALDTFSVGAQVPAVAVAPMMGDIADLHAFGRWRGGKWTLELARRLNTGSRFDARLIDTLYLSLAVFDNAEKKHAYALRPIRVIFER